MVGDAGRRHRAGRGPSEAALRRELREELGLEEFDAGPLVWTHERTFPWAQRLMHQVNDVYLVRVDAHEPQPTIDLEEEARRQLPLVDARRDRGDATSA